MRCHVITCNNEAIARWRGYGPGLGVVTYPLCGDHDFPTSARERHLINCLEGLRPNNLDEWEKYSGDHNLWPGYVEGKDGKPGKPGKAPKCSCHTWNVGPAHPGTGSPPQDLLYDKKSAEALASPDAVKFLNAAVAILSAATVAVDDK